MARAFKEHRVVPDTLQVWPDQVLEAHYHNGPIVQEGNEIAESKAQGHLTISFDSQVGKFYTLMLLDPDAPSHAEPKWKHFCHWLVVNIPGTGTRSKDNIAKGSTICPYMGPAPPKGTGLHRYVFIIYEHDAAQDSFKITGFGKDPESRKSFHHEQWLKDNIPGESRLYAANFFSSQHES